ncbi:hypothetical protein [Reichenbachiella sp.]|uniref:hypothetical protein n=1 Tax=Reichenbachiella sp. TaxID=2184521 RepID=UPI003B5CCF53
MKNLSLKLEESIFDETEDILAEINKKRNKYINEAVAFYNKLYKRKLMRNNLAAESAIAYGSSLEVMEEFEALEDDLNFLD